MRMHVLGMIGAAALTAAASGSASALTFSSITETPGLNSGVQAIYSSNSRAGFYGVNTLFLTADATLRFEYLGGEAGNTNTFAFNGNDLFSGGNVTFTNSPGVGRVADVAASAGFLNFSFSTSTGGTVTNNTNPDGDPPPNGSLSFFTTFGPLFQTSGLSVDLWFDDGNVSDDNHDDMAIRISILGDVTTFSVVPLPAPILLLLSALGGLGFVGHRAAGRKLAA